MMPKNNEGDLGQSLSHYITALSLLNKSDIHIQFEPNIYANFYGALKFAMKHFGDWDGVLPFFESFKRFCDKLNIESIEQEKHLEFFQFFILAPRVNVKCNP